ncbi:hypothetical protein CS022_01805 [Veronia nyctiphanis]|uniref:Uncharacterized protein n=1 Tax=Veronia nyctiphanis TaxID=1278244 RepID=A0A4Q0YUJ6_9GAMM|nr:hypothetical protein [Veronia nyctiphanis]RXJ74940.1 hypothetical protein CS022_01805 [Veronia nyctiphanis]
MNAIKATIIGMTLSLAFSGQAVASTNHSKKAVDNASTAGSASAASTVHSMAASGQVALAASAAPFLIVGGLGALSESAGKAALDFADINFDKPLDVCEESFTAYPSPAEALSGQ